jgi:hypothetical protein
MWRLAPTSSPFILAISFLCIGMMRIPNLLRLIDRLHVSPKIRTALIFLVEYPLEFPFSSAMLIRSTGYFYYRSSHTLLDEQVERPQAGLEAEIARRAMQHRFEHIGGHVCLQHGR